MVFNIAIWITISLIVYNYLSFSLHTYHSDIPPITNKKYHVIIVSPGNYAAEHTESIINCLALNSLGSDCYILEYNGYWQTPWHRTYSLFFQKIINFLIKPDFFYYNTISLLEDSNDYVKYGILDVIREEITGFQNSAKISDKVIDIMTHYNGFIVYGDESTWAKDFIQKLLSQNSDASMDYFFNFYPSSIKTSLNQKDKKELVLWGSYWDKKRSSNQYMQIYNLLDQKDYFNVYGPKPFWHFMTNSYRGFIQVDENSVINKVSDHGIALVLHSDLHFDYGVPSKRIFEAAAASTVIISDKNPFVVKHFSDCAFLIDTSKKPEQVVEDIDTYVKLIKSNKELAKQKAACAHNAFLKKFTQEEQWKKFLEFHERASAKYAKEKSTLG